MNKNLGLYCGLFSLVIYIGLIVFVIARLPVKLDTLLMFSWPILPGIVGSFIFYRMDQKDAWNK